MSASSSTFTLAAFLFFYGYYAPGPQQYRGLWRVAAGAVCACFSFLAYPQSAAAAPFLLGLWLPCSARRCGALLFGELRRLRGRVCALAAAGHGL